MPKRKIKKLSQKERTEFVNKGYLEDQDYVTKDFLESQNYVTKDYLDKKIDEDMVRHIGAITESFDERLRVFLEGLDIRIERMENVVFRHDAKLQNHDTRISTLELKTKNI